MVVSSKESHGKKTDMAVNGQDYLLRYKMSMFMYDPKEVTLNPATYSEYKEPKNPRQDLPARRKESRSRDVVEGISGTLHSLNILLLQEGVDGLERLSET